MRTRFLAVTISLLLNLQATSASADEYIDTVSTFKSAGESGSFFNNSYGYAVFPTIGKGGFWIGGAYGSGRVYRLGSAVGDTTMAQLSIGFQLGGQAFSQIIFFKDKRAFTEFTEGNFEFGADAGVVAITAGANASASTRGVSAGASAGKNDANTVGRYYKGMAIFTIAKGGLMYEATVSGQKFSYQASR